MNCSESRYSAGVFAVINLIGSGIRNSLWN